MVDAAPERTEFPLDEHPRLRPIEVFPIHDRGRRSLVLRDPSDPSINPIVLSDGAAEVLVLLDGQRTLRDVSNALLLRGASQLARLLGDGLTGAPMTLIQLATGDSENFQP